MGQHAHLYNSEWRKARRIQLANHPLCVHCLRIGRVTPATVVDHIKPHKGDLVAFWDVDNWQSLCKSCHDSHKQSVEKGGHGRHGVDTNGLPLDPEHPWNA